MYKYLFGPVPSRRLGMSLGVDLVPHKVCTFNCVYCECGKTTNLTMERKEYVPVEEVYQELLNFMNVGPNPDYLTFSGSGEPTLNSKIGFLIRKIKEHKDWPKVAVLTNGSLLSDPLVREELEPADLVLPSLDSALDNTYRKIDRPHKGLDLKTYVQGLVDFRKEYKGGIWLEVVILPGFNDQTDELDALKNAILRIKPDRVQLNTLDRPGAVSGLTAASAELLNYIVEYWDLPYVEIVSKAADRDKLLSYRKDTESAILETIKRRPCTVEDLAKVLGTHINEVNKYLGVLEKENKIKGVSRDRGVFYLLCEESGN